jgi:hypothetical protein
VCNHERVRFALKDFVERPPLGARAGDAAEEIVELLQRRHARVGHVASLVEETLAG